MRAKLGEVAPPDAIAIAGLRDQAALTELVTALAPTEREVRAALDRAIASQVSAG